MDVSLERSSFAVEEVVGEGEVDKDGAECARATFAGEEGLDVEGGEGWAPTSKGRGHGGLGEGRWERHSID